MIHTVLVERGFVYWADAGDRFKSVAGLTETLRNVKQKGFASRHSSGHVRDWTHPMQLDYFGANNHGIKKQPNCDASGIGFTLQRCTPALQIHSSISLHFLMELVLT